jgi:AraC-like DNA-binding protein
VAAITVGEVSYRETPPPPALRELVECGWHTDGVRSALRVLPDGCMDLMRINGRVVVAGPDTTAFLSDQAGAGCGLRFRPGALPRLLGVPAAQLQNLRVPLDELRPDAGGGSLVAIATRLATATPRTETAPWSLGLLNHVTQRLTGGLAVSLVADEIGWSTRNLQRQCAAVYGYGPATLRRVLRFRSSTALLRSGLPLSEVAARSGYADAPHLHREVRELSGVGVTALRQEFNAANRSTVVPSGSVRLA